MGVIEKARGFMSTRFSRSVDNRRLPENESRTAKVYVNVEFLRVVAYTNFFIMIICAIIFNKTLASPRLKDGPDDDGDICGEWDGSNGDAVDPPVLPGEGFDVSTQSHLIRAFGYNNVCANWDYSPSREITALIYPIFEYSLLLYLFFDFIQVWLYYKKGWCSKAYYYTFKVAVFFMLLGCAWFRMIFVVIAYVDLSGHTAGFFCLQFTLIITAMMNTLFIIDTKCAFKFLGGRKGTLIAAYTYIIVNFVISIFKLILTGHIVFNGKPASWALDSIGSQLVGQFVDNVWFVCNAVIPLVVAIVRSASEQPLKISIDCPSCNWSGEERVGGEDEDAERKMINDAANA